MEPTEDAALDAALIHHLQSSHMRDTTGLSTAAARAQHKSEHVRPGGVYRWHDAIDLRGEPAPAVSAALHPWNEPSGAAR